MSGWDWLRAGLEAATYAKARQAQRDLADMKTAAEMESARRVLIEAMRGFVFDISRDIRLAEEQLTEYPQQVYIISRLLDWRLADSGLSAEIFPDFQDKEYVFNTQKKISEVIEKSRASLTQEQIQQSDVAVQYLAEMPLLQRAIADHSARESLKATDEQWRKLSRRQRGKVILSIAGILLGCWGILIFLEGLIFIIGAVGNDKSLLMVAPVAFAIGALFIKGSRALKTYGGRSNPEYASLTTNRTAWQKQLMSEEDRQQVISVFGDLTSEQLQKIYEERFAFLKPLLGDDFQRYLTS